MLPTCIDSADTFVPKPPVSYFPYFHTGCYTLCQQWLPLTLFDPPDVSFPGWSWLENDTSFLSVTTDTMPPGPDSVTVEILLTLPDGKKCFQEVRVPLPWPCPWIPERQALPHSDSANAGSNNSVQNVVSNALLVFPNPASYDVSVSYDYGNDAYTQKELAVFDAMGSKIQSLTPQDIHGSWNLNTANWSPGMYLVRMEADGNTLQVQRVVISH